MLYSTYVYGRPLRFLDTFWYALRMSIDDSVSMCLCVFVYFDFASDPQSSTTVSACLSCILRRLHEPRVLHCVLRGFLSVPCNSRVFDRVVKSYNLFSIGLQSSWGGFVWHRVFQGGYTKLRCWCCVFVGFASIYGALRLASWDSVILTNARWCSTTSTV